MRIFSTHTILQVIKDAETALDSLVSLMDEGALFFGGSIHKSLDAFVFSCLHTIFSVRAPGNTLKEMILQRPVLETFTKTYYVSHATTIFEHLKRMS